MLAKSGSQTQLSRKPGIRTRRHKKNNDAYRCQRRFNHTPTTSHLLRVMAVGITVSELIDAVCSRELYQFWADETSVLP